MTNGESDRRPGGGGTARVVAGPGSPAGRRFLGFLAETAAAIAQGDAPRLAAAITYYVILSVFPALLILTALLGFLPEGVAGSAQTHITDGLKELFGDNADQLVTSVDAVFERSSSSLLTIGMVLALWTTSSAAHMMIIATSRIHGLADRPWLRARGIAVLLAGGSILVGAALVALVVVIPSVGTHFDVDLPSGMTGAVAGLAAFAACGAWALVTFQVSPSSRTPISADLPGAALAGVLVLVVTVGFRMYLEFAARVGSVTVTIGGGIVILTWVYLIALSYLAGAAVNHVLWLHDIGLPRGDRGSTRPRLPVDQRHVYVAGQREGSDDPEC